MKDQEIHTFISTPTSDTELPPAPSSWTEFGLFLGCEERCVVMLLGWNMPALTAALLFLFIIFPQPILLFSLDQNNNKLSIDN